MTDCIFCKIINKELPTEILYDDKDFVVFADINPKATTHLLLVPKLHIPSLASLEGSHKELMGNIMCSLPSVTSKLNIKDFRTIINTGAGGGQEVFHIHLHLLAGKLHSM